MRTRMITLSLLLVGALSAAPALADKNNVEHARAELALKEKAQELGDRCGVAPKTIIDWKSFPKDFGNYSVSGYCSAAIEAVEHHCRGKAKKALLQKKLKSVVCAYGGKGKRALTVSKGTITYTVDFEAVNASDYTRKELLRRF